MYKLKEIYFTLQGEGYHTGRTAVFCRFTGCNLWSGKEEDRKSAVCRFCDTDFRDMSGENGGRYTAYQLVQKCTDLWPANMDNRFVVCTGGEPALQMDDELVPVFHEAGFYVAIETNGTIALPCGLDWICMSPKAGTVLKVRHGNELKLVYPQEGINPLDFESLEFDHFYIQPMDGPDLDRNVQLSIDFCKLHTNWKLSLQTHKLLGIP